MILLSHHMTDYVFLPLLKVFLRGIVRVIPYIVPIAVVAILLVSYFAYMALRLFNHRREGGALELS